MAEERYVQEVRSMQEAVRKKINSIERVELEGKIDWGFTPSFSAKVSGHLEFKVLSYGPDKNKLDSLIKSVIHDAARSYWKEEGGVDITSINTHKYDGVFSKTGFWGEYHESYTLGVRCNFILNNANPIYAKGKTASSAAPSHSKQASFKIEGANSEVSSKIKSAESKLLAKGKAKMPNAKEFKVKMRPNLVKASNGAFYGGHLYGTEDGTKWMKCAEVRIREGKEGAATKPTEKVSEKHHIKETLHNEIRRILSGKSWDFKDLRLIKFDEVSSGELQAEFSLSAENKSGSGKDGFRRGSAWEEWGSTQRSVELTIVTSLSNSFKLPGYVFSHARVYFQRNAPRGKRFKFSFALKLSRK